MKNKILAALLAAGLMATSNAANASDACEVVLCMFGKLKGENPSECKAAQKKYFSIQVKKKGKFKASRTAKERLKFLNKCPSPENNNINKKFGTMRWG